MHYSASIAQLVATIIMTVLRVAIRRHISQEPQKHTHTTENEVQTPPSDIQRPNEFELTPTSGPKQQTQEQGPARYAVQELTDGHELDIIAMQLQACKLWRVVAFSGLGQDTGSGPPQDTSVGKLAENVLKTRIRLTKLLQSPWDTKISEQAKVLSETMAGIMNSLWYSEGASGSMPTLMADASMGSLSWEIPIEVRANSGTSKSLESISISLRRKKLADDKWKPWETDMAQVEAVLQLWILRLSTYTKGDGNVLWLLCPDDDYKAAMIADWWIGREAGSVSDKTLEDICKEYSISTFAEYHEGSSSTDADINNCIIGCIGASFKLDTSVPILSTPRLASPDIKGRKVTRAIVQHMELGSFATQYILYTFLTRLVQSIDVTAPTVVRDEQATGPLLRNDTITELALMVQEGGLCNVPEASRMVLCAFAAQGKLPVPYRQSADPFLLLYQKALEVGYKHKAENDEDPSAAQRAEKIYVEALRLCKFEALEIIEHSGWVAAGKFVVRTARISESFFTLESKHMRETRDLMLWVGSKFVSNSSLERLNIAARVDATDGNSTGAMPSPTDSRPKPISVPSKLITAVCSQDANEVQRLLVEAVNDNTDSSIDKARALDRAAQQGNKEIVILLHLYGASSRAPLWWAVDGTRMRNKGTSHESDPHRIETDCVELLKLLLDFGHDPNGIEHKEGESPLHLAAKLNLMKAMETLLEIVEHPSTRSLASIDLKDQNGLSPLYYATKEGYGAMTKLLVDHGANVKGEIGPENKSLMHYATIHGDRVILKILHENGGDIEAFDAEGKAPLYYAAMGGSKELLEMILEMGADINRKCPQSQGGLTPLHWMAREGNAAAIRILLDKEASLDEGDESGKTALHHAVKEGQKAAVYVLLEKGAALDKEDTTGKTPLAYTQGLLQGDADAADIIWLLNHERDIKLDEGKQTALHRVAAKSGGDEPAVEILLRCSADLEAQDENLWTPLHQAANAGHERVVQILLDKGAEVNVKHKQLWTPLHQAANGGYEQVVQMLLDKGAEVSAKTELESTPLHLAAREGHVSVIQALLHRSADILASARNGDTPLHSAVQGQKPQAIQFLINIGANLHVTNTFGKTPEYYATRPFEGYEANPEVAKLFHTLRNQKAGGTSTEKEGERAPSAGTGNDNIIKEAKRIDAMDIGPLVAPPLVPTPEANITETQQ